jgi:5-formyltetrahydrofolate cyclo-ligase
MQARGHGFIPSSAEEVLRQRVKAELRKRLSGLRNTLPASACAERSGRVVRAVAVLEAVQSARSVALFWPIERRHEVDLRPLDAHLRERGVRVAYPRIEPNTRAMTFRFSAEPGSAPESLARPGLYQPEITDEQAAPGELDVIVVPALAVDPRGHRIGYGAGHYDATLPAFSPPAATVAVAFDFQLVAEVPTTPGDVSLHWVVTDARTIAASA